MSADSDTRWYLGLILFMAGVIVWDFWLSRKSDTIRASAAASPPQVLSKGNRASEAIIGRIVKVRVRTSPTGDSSREHLDWLVRLSGGRPFWCDWRGGDRSFCKGQQVLLTTRDGYGEMIALSGPQKGARADVRVLDLVDLFPEMDPDYDMLKAP